MNINFSLLIIWGMGTLEQTLEPKKLRLGFDFDSVISDCSTLKAEYAKQLYNFDIRPEIFKWYPLVTEGIMTKEQYITVQRAIYDGEESNSRMPAVDGALTYLPKLISEGHDIRVVTGRAGVTADLARRWLAKHELNIPLYGVGPTNIKTAECVGLDFFVDDDLEKLQHLVGTVPNLYLFHWEYNKNVANEGVAKRVHSWREIYDITQSLRC